MWGGTAQRVSGRWTRLRLSGAGRSAAPLPASEPLMAFLAPVLQGDGAEDSSRCQDMEMPDFWNQMQSSSSSHSQMEVIILWAFIFPLDWKTVARISQEVLCFFLADACCMVITQSADREGGVYGEGLPLVHEWYAVEGGDGATFHNHTSCSSWHKWTSHLFNCM